MPRDAARRLVRYITVMIRSPLCRITPCLLAYMSTDSWLHAHALTYTHIPGKAHGAVGWVLEEESSSGADFVSWWFQCVPISSPLSPSYPPPFHPPRTPEPGPSQVFPSLSSLSFCLHSPDVFAATGATIVSGAVAERTQLCAAIASSNPQPKDERSSSTLTRCTPNIRSTSTPAPRPHTLLSQVRTSRTLL